MALGPRAKKQLQVLAGAAITVVIVLIVGVILIRNYLESEKLNAATRATLEEQEWRKSLLTSYFVVKGSIAEVQFTEVGRMRTALEFLANQYDDAADSSRKGQVLGTVQFSLRESNSQHDAFYNETFKNGEAFRLNRQYFFYHQAAVTWETKSVWLDGKDLFEVFNFDSSVTPPVSETEVMNAEVQRLKAEMRSLNFQVVAFSKIDAGLILLHAQDQYGRAHSLEVVVGEDASQMSRTFTGLLNEARGNDSLHFRILDEFDRITYPDARYDPDSCERLGVFRMEEVNSELQVKSYRTLAGCLEFVPR